MKIRLDHCVDIRFKQFLPGHMVIHTKEQGWEHLSNGNLLSAAETEEFEVFITVDKGLRHQQNIAKRTLCVITLGSLFTGIDDIQSLAPSVLTLMAKGIEQGQSYLITS